MPSASLNVAIAAGTFINQAGTATAYAGTASQATTASSTNYLYLTNGGTLTVNTSGFPAGPTLYCPLAVVVAGSSTITSVTDARVCLPVVGAGFLPLGGGTLTDGANIVLGSTTGTETRDGDQPEAGLLRQDPGDSAERRLRDGRQLVHVHRTGHVERRLLALRGRSRVFSVNQESTE